MSSSVEATWSAVRDQYQTLSADTTTVWQYGAGNLSRSYGSDRRVVCVWDGDTYETPSRSPRRPGAGPAETRITYHRRSAVSWHVFGADEEEIEALAHNVIVILFRLYGAATETCRVLGLESQQRQLGALSDLPYAILRTAMVYEVDADLIELPQTVVDGSTHVGKFNGDEVC